jgi:hypothetical protein
MSDTACNPWGILTNICSTKYGEKMSTLPGCSSYNALCNSGTTAVNQCSIRGIANLVPTATAMQDVTNLCQEMPDMPECSLCTDAISPALCPDPLYALSAICLSMWMSDCARWESMCPVGTVGLVPFCGGSSTASSGSGSSTVVSGVETTTQCRGSMIMYFHHGYNGALAPRAASITIRDILDGRTRTSCSGCTVAIVLTSPEP